MHDRGPPREQKLMRPPVPQLPVSTRENLVKKFFRAAHKLPCGSSMQRECRNMPLNQSIRRSAAAILCRGGQQRFSGLKMPESNWRIHSSNKSKTRPCQGDTQKARSTSVQTAADADVLWI